MRESDFGADWMVACVMPATEVAQPVGDRGYRLNCSCSESYSFHIAHSSYHMRLRRAPANKCLTKHQCH